jgi:hypothetical protein
VVHVAVVQAGRSASPVRFDRERARDGGRRRTRRFRSGR